MAHRFEMLDVIRGLAALVVAERHLAHYFFDQQLPGSYLAVDIFFVLSGFVLAHAYEVRFAGGMRAREFFVIRVIRLYPLYLVAFLLGVLMLWVGDATLPGWYLPTAGVLAALFLPMLVSPPPGAPVGTLYPLDYPTWTLLFELMANLLHALLAPRLTNRLLHGLIAVSGGLLIAATVHFNDLDVGHRDVNYLAGIPRVCFSYFLGVRLFRHWQSRPSHTAPSTWAVVAAVIAIMLLPVPPEYRAYYDLLTVLVLIPALVYHAASVTLTSRWLLPLGTASYALYVLHVPFGALCDGVAGHFGIRIAGFAPWGGVMIMAGLLALTLTLDRYYDRPVRKWLLRRFA